MNGYVSRRAQRALLIELLARSRATADDVRRRVMCPEGVDPKAFGSVPTELAHARIIERDGFEKSTRPEAHARPVTAWRLINRAAAEAWLAVHPELPEPIKKESEPAPTGSPSQRSLFS